MAARTVPPCTGHLSRVAAVVIAQAVSVEAKNSALVSFIGMASSKTSIDVEIRGIA
jgi:hypothetical protein